MDHPARCHTEMRFICLSLRSDIKKKRALVFLPDVGRTKPGCPQEDLGCSFLWFSEKLAVSADIYHTVRGLSEGENEHTTILKVT